MTIIEHIATGDRWVIEDNIPFPAKDYKIIGNVDDLIKKEKKEIAEREIRAYVSKCYLQPRFCDVAPLYEFT